MLIMHELNLLSKRGSRHAAHAAKALRWRVDQLLKYLIKKNILFSVMVYLMFRSALATEVNPTKFLDTNIYPWTPKRSK